MMKQFQILICLLALCFAACGGDEPSPSPVPPDPPEPTGQSERTVLVYMAAHNNLSGFSSLDIDEMIKGSLSLSDKQNLMLFVDDQSSSEKSYFIRVKNGKLIDSTFVADQSSADPALLEKALRYMRETYPAKSYGLVLWGHANGWIIKKDSIVYNTRAYGLDNNFSQKWMNIPSMACAIKRGMSGEKLTFIHGDCCNFGCVESAYELRDVCDYVIGSPAEIPDLGNYYGDLSGYFDTSSTFYKKIIDLYYDYYLKYIPEHSTIYYIKEYGDLDGYSVPFMAVKTSELENLASATASLLSTIPDKLSPTGTLDYSKVIYYGCYDGQKFNYDMYKTLKMNTAAADFNAWTPAFEKAVPYFRMSACWYTVVNKLKKEILSFDTIQDDCHALAMFFPGVSYNDVNPSWNKTVQQLQWNGPISWQQYGW